jgi:hypothetical protein
MNDRWSALRQTLKNRLPRFMGADLKVTAHMPAAAEVKRGPNRRQSKFEKFHEANPHVYELLVQLAREYIRRTGQRKLGIGMLWERLRWEMAISTTGDFKLNNNYRAHYASDHASRA